LTTKTPQYIYIDVVKYGSDPQSEKFNSADPFGGEIDTTKI